LKADKVEKSTTSQGRLFHTSMTRSVRYNRAATTMLEHLKRIFLID